MWTWTALDAESKLKVSWRLGNRDTANAWAFIADLNERLANRVQLISDGRKHYLEPIENYMGGAVDFAQLVKHVGNEDPDTNYKVVPNLWSIEDLYEALRAR